MTRRPRETPDTSVVVAALSSWHVDHDEAVDALVAPRVIGAHVLTEAYSVLTRLPPGRRVSVRVAHEALVRTFPGEPLALTGTSVRSLLDRLVELGVSGGATYDALVAETARFHDLRLVTGDRRAMAVYDALGVEVRFIGTSA